MKSLIAATLTPSSLTTSNAMLTNTRIATGSKPPGKMNGIQVATTSLLGALSGVSGTAFLLLSELTDEEDPQIQNDII